MNKKQYRCSAISDFTINNFANYLNNSEDFPVVTCQVAPFDQVNQVLQDKDLECWKNNPDFTVVWTQPERIIKSFNDVINYKRFSIEKIFNEVDEYSSLLLDISNDVKVVFIPLWILPPYHRGLGMLDMKNGIGICNTLMRMNLRLSENLDKASNIFILNTNRWLNLSSKKAINPKLWYMAKIPFGNDLFIEAVKDIKSALQGIAGNSRKLILLDLDDTLWGGIVGDIGWKNITLGGHDPLGEAFVDFQLALKSLTNRGIILGIISKNEESTALEAINNHPEMILKLDDFAGWKINWQDKAQNIVDLVAELNLGLQSVVFIDDNPVERARVSEALPEVFVPEWPEEKMQYKSQLLNLYCFDTPSISKEDIARKEAYTAERQRKSLKRKIDSSDEWLKSLETKVKIEELNEINLRRTTQLLNKTNQMNLSTRRMTESELLNWTNWDHHKLWVFRVSDKFGDSGLTGIISIEIENNTAKIVDFVLSCRVMGRKIEETMLATVIKYCQSIGLNELYAIYIPTPKNKPCLTVWKKTGFLFNEENNCFTWQLKNNFPTPESVTIENVDGLIKLVEE